VWAKRQSGGGEGSQRLLSMLHDPAHEKRFPVMISITSDPGQHSGRIEFSRG
jgi:hypothetical protein